MSRHWAMREVSREKTSDRSLGDKVHKATLHTVHRRDQLVAEIPNWEELRSEARQARLRSLNNHRELLSQFKDKLEARGVQVLMVKNAAEARAQILRLVLEAGQRVTKSKSMTSEEIELNPALQLMGVQVTETDLGELIVQLANQAPSHITAPAIHLSVEDIARIFEKSFGMELPAWVSAKEKAAEPVRRAFATELSLKARAELREKFLHADVGISGANFLVAESGTIVLVENEGNIQLTTCLPKRHIVLAGIDKLIATDDDLGLLLRLLPISATAQRQSCYVSMFSDAHPDMHVILLDNGRSKLMRDTEQRDLATCIRCGACMNVCPVYRNVGGHAYGGAYPGPIGALLLPHLGGMARYSELPFASSLCGACTEACPVKIPLHKRLLELRARAVSGGRATELGVPMKLATMVMRNKSSFELSGRLYKLGRPLAAMVPLGHAWAETRALPEPPSQSFRSWWRDHKSPSPSPSPSPLEGETSSVLQHSPGKKKGWELFVSRIAELGPEGQTEVHTFEKVEQVRTYLREILREYAPDDVLISTGDSSSPAASPKKRDYKLGISSAVLGIADSGGLMFDMNERADDWAISLVETQIALLSKNDIVDTVQDAVRRRKELRSCGKLRGIQVMVTGPSRTADVEKVLVIPAHGPRRLIVVLCEEALPLHLDPR